MLHFQFRFSKMAFKYIRKALLKDDDDLDVQILILRYISDLLKYLRSSFFYFKILSWYAALRNENPFIVIKCFASVTQANIWNVGLSSVQLLSFLLDGFFFPFDSYTNDLPFVSWVFFALKSRVNLLTQKDYIKRKHISPFCLLNTIWEELSIFNVLNYFDNFCF